MQALGRREMGFVANVAGKRKRRLTALPLLVVVFVVSYYLLTKLVIEQDRTIDSQHSLIHQLFKDNLNLSALRKHVADFSKKNRATAGIQVQPESSPQAQANQVESTQIPLKQVPSDKAGLQANTKTARRTRKDDKALSAKPPVQPTDPSDMRRVLFSI